MRSDLIIIGAGGLALAGNFAREGGFPENGYSIIGATIGLAFLASITNRTMLAPAVRMAALLMLLVSAYLYIPALRKANRNG